MSTMSPMHCFKTYPRTPASCADFLNAGSLYAVTMMMFAAGSVPRMARAADSPSTGSIMISIKTQSGRWLLYISTAASPSAASMIVFTPGMPAWSTPLRDSRIRALSSAIRNIMVWSVENEMPRIQGPMYMRELDSTREELLNRRVTATQKYE
jgi:hypothetical protein